MRAGAANTLGQHAIVPKALAGEGQEERLDWYPKSRNEYVERFFTKSLDSVLSKL